MDKHELDDYLNTNDEDNSQGQETELLQYFQTGDAENNNNNNKSTPQQHQQQQQSNIDAHNPMLAAMNANSAFETPHKRKPMNTAGIGNNFTKDRDDITQLRNYLHQNFNKDSNETIGVTTTAASVNQRGNNIQGQKHTSNGNHCIIPGIYNEGSASASLAIMSQKHLNETSSESRVIAAAAAAAASLTKTTATQPAGITAALLTNHSTPISDTIQNNARATQKRKINLNAMVSAPSTTKGRKNCTFFPISQHKSV